MTRFLTAMVALMVGSTTMARGETFVYVSLAPEKKIQVLRLDPAESTLTPIAQTDVDGSPGSLGVSPDKRKLYASLRTSGKLAAFRIDPATGKLSELNAASLPAGENAAFVGVDATGKWLLSASYSAGKVVVHGLNDDGSIRSPSVQTVSTAKTAHCVAIDRDNRWVFVPHVAPNAVFQFRWDASSGQLSDAGRAAGGAEGAGPRHLAFHPSQKWAFTSDETGSSITAYRFDPASGLTPVQTLPTLPAGFEGKNSTAEVKVHPSGRYVWVSNRGHDSLAGFAIDADSGKLTALGQTPTERIPRSFTVTSDGKFVLSAGEGSGKLAIYACDPNTGKLGTPQVMSLGASLTWVTTVAP